MKENCNCAEETDPLDFIGIGTASINEDGKVPGEIISINEIDNENLRNWLSMIGWGGEKKLLITKEKYNEKTSYTIRLFTEKRMYSIYAHDKRYLGCVMGNRAPLPGEKYKRGADLPDGSFSYSTWVKILASIVGMESLKIEVPICDKEKNENNR